MLAAIRVAEVLSDEDLVLRAQSGDELAFTELVHRHERQVHTLAIRMLRDPATAEDVLQETFISALRGLKSFRGESSFATWLYRIAYNATLMKLRKSTPTLSLDEWHDQDEGEMPRELLDWTHNPEAEVLTRETREAMQAAVDTLSPPLRSVFVLRDLDGLATEETAAVLGVSKEVVKTRLHRARLLLREQLSEHFSSRRNTIRN